MLTVFLGGPLDGRQIEMDHDQTEYFTLSGETKIRYIKKMWSTGIDPVNRSTLSEAFFVPETMTQTEASEAFLKHLRQS
jgi:hypothetical protein